jgi:hypothetical protein
LKDRTQFVKVRDVLSDCLVTNAGAPQGTRAGSDDFKLLINDLRCNEHSVKYVDDVSMASVSDDPLNDVMQTSINELEQWSQCNSMRLNNKKTKEMILHFGRRFAIDAIPNLVASGSNIERVNEFKLLGVIVRSDLNWTSHVKYMVSKASKRIFVICTLVRSGIPVADIIAVYCSLVRSVLEYASPVWHCGLTKLLTREIENVQKRCLKIIFPVLSYNDALKISGLERLSDRREKAAHELFN